MAEQSVKNSPEPLNFEHSMRDTGLWLFMVLGVSLMAYLLRSMAEVDQDVFMSIYSIALVGTGGFLFAIKESVLSVSWRKRILVMTVICFVFGGGVIASFLFLTGSF